MIRALKSSLLGLCVLWVPAVASAQERAQFPHWLVDSFINVNVGAMHYRFSDLQLEPGHTVARIHAPKPAVRAAMAGKHFGKHLSAQLTYMRPVEYVSYRGLNGTDETQTVWMHYASLTMKAHTRVAGRWSVFGEAGGGLTTRSGFERNGAPVVTDAMIWRPVFGAGVDYRVNERWEVTGGVLWLPGKSSVRQPRSTFVSTGFRYTMRPLSDARVQATRQAGHVFPRRMLTAEYTTGTGYTFNTFLSRKVPIFWGGNIKVDQGVALHYEQNVFHSKSLFSLGLGASASLWKTRARDERFYTLSLYPIMRFTFLRTRPADFYAMYSMAGPTFISKTLLDSRNSGRKFTFQDFLGIGVFAGRQRQVNVGLKINHYSNGNIFPHNAGVKVPLTLMAGYTF